MSIFVGWKIFIFLACVNGEERIWKASLKASGYGPLASLKLVPLLFWVQIWCYVRTRMVSCKWYLYPGIYCTVITPQTLSGNCIQNIKFIRIK